MFTHILPINSKAGNKLNLQNPAMLAVMFDNFSMTDAKL